MNKVKLAGVHEDTVFARVNLAKKLLRLFIFPMMLSLLLLSGCAKADIDTTPSEGNVHLQVHFLDVGQADSTLLVFPGGQSILIDGGNREDGPEVINYLKSHKIKELSAIVATHPHEDHIGGLDLVIQNIPTKSVYLPNATHSARTFEEFISAVNASGAKKIQAKAGVLLNIPGITGLFVAPVSNSYEDLNNYSAVLKITYDKVSFLFLGDAEDFSETEMLKSGQDLNVNVLKVGHHGSKSSTTSEFLKAVSPEHAIISSGADNKYGHPDQTVLDRLAKARVNTYRTDQLGTIVATTDGVSVKFDKKGLTQPIDSNTTVSSSPTQTPAQAPPVPSIESLVELSSIDLRKEIVIIVNNSIKTVNLTGWKLVSEVGDQTYHFPSGTTLVAGGSLKIVSGENALPGIDSLVWTQSNIWNNNGDPGALYDAQGKLVSKF